MTAIQAILVAFAAFAGVKAFSRFRAGALSAAHLVGWLIVWAAVVVIALRPETASALARVLGVGRGADVVLYAGLAAAFYLLFRMFARLEELERQLTRIVRDLALGGIGKKDRHDEA